MKKVLLIISSLFILTFSAYSVENAYSASNISIEDLSPYFTNFTGCFVLYNETKDKYIPGLFTSNKNSNKLAKL